MSTVLAVSLATALLTPHLPRAGAPARAAVRMVDPALVADSVANLACMTAASTCTWDVSPFEPHLMEGWSTLGGDISWTFGVAGLGLAGAYLTQGAEAISMNGDESETWFDEEASPPRSLQARPFGERERDDDAWLRDDPSL